MSSLSQNDASMVFAFTRQLSSRRLVGRVSAYTQVPIALSDPKSLLMNLPRQEKESMADSSLFSLFLCFLPDLFQLVFRFGCVLMKLC